MPTAIILNPTSGRGRGAKMRPLIEAALPGATIFETTRQGGAAELARQAHTEGYDLVVAAGGDGTLGEVLNGIYGTRAKLGLIPVGTGNDFARTLGIGTDLDLALKTIEKGECRSVDVGLAKFGAQNRYFINVCGAGFDSRCAARINERRPQILKRLSGTTAYVTAVLCELRTFELADIRLELDGRTVETRGALCAIANSKTYGGGMKVAPDADISDGLFDICLIKDVSAWEFLKAFPGVFAGKHVQHPKVEMFRAARVKLESDPPLPVLVDGDILGSTPALFEILPGRIDVLTPPQV